MTTKGSITAAVYYVDAQPLEDLVNEVRQLRQEVAELKKGTPPELSGLVTLHQVADYLGVKSHQTARAWCHKNKVKLRKIGASTRVLGEDVYRVLKK